MHLQNYGEIIMTKQEMIKIAKRAVDKGWDFEALKYGDDMYGKESLTDDVWEYVEECKRIGTDAFYAKHNV
jgi:biotin synthase-like enzyme